MSASTKRRKIILAAMVGFAACAPDLDRNAATIRLELVNEDPNTVIVAVRVTNENASFDYEWNELEFVGAKDVEVPVGRVALLVSTLDEQRRVAQSVDVPVQALPGLNRVAVNMQPPTGDDVISEVTSPPLIAVVALPAQIPQGSFDVSATLDAVALDGFLDAARQTLGAEDVDLTITEVRLQLETGGLQNELDDVWSQQVLIRVKGRGVSNREVARFTPTENMEQTVVVSEGVQVDEWLQASQPPVEVELSGLGAGGEGATTLRVTLRLKAEQDA